jgi:hypothetical protein
MGEKMKVRDKFWIFTSRAHDDDIYFQRCQEKFINWSRITPAEGAFMLGVPNAMMVVSDGQPVSYSAEAYGYLESFYRMKNVLWSVTGSGSFRIGNEEQFICDMAEKYPNIKGAFLDDMFGWDEDGSNEEKYAKQLLEIREKLDKACRPMEIWATCYIKDVKKYSAKMYDPVDVITIWNMDTTSIDTKLESDFEMYEQLLPNKKKALGIYIYDYITASSVTIERMEKQCETGLKWLKEGRIEGMIFLTNCTMGIGLPSEKWLRDWIDKVGDEEL